MTNTALPYFIVCGDESLDRYEQTLYIVHVFKWDLARFILEFKDYHLARFFKEINIFFVILACNRWGN